MDVRADDDGRTVDARTAILLDCNRLFPSSYRMPKNHHQGNRPAGARRCLLLDLPRAPLHSVSL